MLQHYLALELPSNATEEEIRDRYLQGVRSHPPARDPKRFQQISTAYEALKNRRARIRTWLFGYAEHGDCKLALDALAEAAPDQRRCPGLRALQGAEGKEKAEDHGHAR